MRKYPLCLIWLLLLPIGSAAQAQQPAPPPNVTMSHLDSLFQQAWVGPGGIFMEVDRVSAFISVGYRHRKTMFELTDSVVNLNKVYHFSGAKEEFVHINEPFKIALLSRDSLIIKPMDEHAARVFKTSGAITFVSLKFLERQPLNFQWVYMKQNGGKAPGKITLILSDGTVHIGYLDAEGVLLHSAEGRLSPQQLEEFETILHTSALSKFAMSKVAGVKDAPETTIRAKYNNTLLSETGNVFPYFGIGLRDYLAKIHTEITLTEDHGAFDFAQWASGH